MRAGFLLPFPFRDCFSVVKRRKKPRYLRLFDWFYFVFVISVFSFAAIAASYSLWIACDFSFGIC